MQMSAMNRAPVVTLVKTDRGGFAVLSAVSVKARFAGV
ncbi:MAG: hypothetical protein OFPI_10770 [Osedax symbiont Rs2]|nr:MAG: hypothetical protein OFPI_10770 [Osedax symbiont Rs2]